jgi:hypothetical protein
VALSLSTGMSAPVDDRAADFLLASPGSPVRSESASNGCASVSPAQMHPHGPQRPSPGPLTGASRAATLCRARLRRAPGDLDALGKPAGGPHYPVWELRNPRHPPYELISRAPSSA